MNKLITIILIVAIVFFGGFIWWNNGVSPINSGDKKPVIFVVKKGSGLKEIAGNLEKAGLIRNRIIFFLYTRLNKYEGKIQAGDFRLNPSMSIREVAENLTHGTLDIWITIPEGERATEIGETLQAKIPSYKSTWPSILTTNEGYLFPDTYLIPKDATIKTIVSQLKSNFDLKYNTIDVSHSKLDKSQIVILASLIEREAITDQEKPIIAGILINRLNMGMALQVDATIQYVKGLNPVTKKWWQPVTIYDYKNIVSPYNTYLQPGLPPGPISNPGIEALKAAANPTDTNYLYYIHDKTGQIRYAITLEGHNANIQKYGLN